MRQAPYGAFFIAQIAYPTSEAKGGDKSSNECRWKCPHLGGDYLEVPAESPPIGFILKKCHFTALESRGAFFITWGLASVPARWGLAGTP